MSSSDWPARHWRLVAATVLFVLFAPAALIAFPLALLLAASRHHGNREILLAAIAGGFSLAWLIRLGTLPDQLLRAAVVISGAVFALASRLTRSTVTHRAIVAVSVTGFALANLLYALGSTWDEVAWWVERNAGRQAILLRQILFALDTAGRSVDPQTAAVIDQTIRFTTDFYPALLAVQLMAGLALATAIYHRVARGPIGFRPGALTDFRFNDNLGWVAIGLLVLMLMPFVAEARLAVGNLLLVLGALYGLRGLAVATFGLRQAGVRSVVGIALGILLALMILPISLAGAILLGIVDSRVAIRERWASP